MFRHVVGAFGVALACASLPVQAGVVYGVLNRGATTPQSQLYTVDTNHNVIAGQAITLGVT